MLRKFRQALLKKATLHSSKSRQGDLAQLLYKLRVEYKVRTFACKGGPTLSRALLKQGLVDQLNLMITPYPFGGANAPMLAGLSQDFFASGGCIARSSPCAWSAMNVF